MSDKIVVNTKVKNRLYKNNSWYGVTVEPTYALYSLVETLSKYLYQNLLVQKFCRGHLVAEPDLYTSCADEKSALEFVAFANSWFLTLAMFATVVYTMMALSWSEKAGKRRKPLLYLPLVGMLLECGFAALQSYYWHWPVSITLILYVLVQVFFGGRVCFAQTVYLYLTDITNKTNRTARYGVIIAIRYFCLPIAYGISGLLMKSIGFFYSFFLCFVLTIIAILFSLVLIRDVSVPVKEKLTFWHMINPMNCVESVKVMCKKRPQNKTAIILMLLLSYMLFSFTNEGELSVIFLYFRARFQWDERYIGFYLAYKLFGMCVGTTICSILLSKYFKLEDSTIGILIAITKIIGAICFLFAAENWQLYIIPLIDLYLAGGITVTRSFATKMLTSNEYGHFAALCSVSKITTPLGNFLYNFTFAKTVTLFPSGFFLISVILSLLILFLICISHWLYKKHDSKTHEDTLIS
ncbi:hypothetical protein PGB90_010503 [Kerria lacca]